MAVAEGDKNQAPDTRTRMRALIATNLFRAGVIVLSAAIIFGAWALARHDGDATDTGQPLVEGVSGDLYERARLAAESEETATALALLERVLAEEPGHPRARALRARLQDRSAAQDTSAGGHGGGEDEPNGVPSDAPGADRNGGAGDEEPRDDSAYLQPVDPLTRLLPDFIEGWERGQPIESGEDAVVPFSPSVVRGVSRALFSVHDRGSPEGAAAFVENTSKVVYGTDGAEVRLGAVDAYFGTDGSTLATIAFARGRYAFELVITAPDGSVQQAKTVALELAEEFGAAN